VTGVNLLNQTFDHMTDTQTQAFQLKTGKQLMDSTLLTNNIRLMGQV